MTDLMFWQGFWFLAIGAALFVFVWLDGFDLGIGMNLPFFKTHEHRLTALNVIWPVWDGNELWGIIGAGSIFAAFPVVFAALLSGLYPWVVLLILGLMLRPLAFEAWGHEPKSKKFWEWLFAFASFLIPFVTGVALGTTIAGMPINGQMVWDHTHHFWEALSPLSVMTGITGVALALLQGSAYLVKRTSGELQAQARKDLTPRVLFAAVSLILVIILICVGPGILAPKPFLVPGLVVGGLLILGGLAAVGLGRREKASDALAYWGSTAVIAGAFVLIGGVQFPTMIRSTIDPSFSLTIFEFGVSSPANSLALMGWIAAVALIITAVYTFFVYRVFKGKIDHNSNPHY